VFHKRIIIGARGSALSIKQAEEVISFLKRQFPSFEFTLKTITTKGDRKPSVLPKEKGLFVKEIEEALLKEEIDLAIHSLKDLPTQLPRDLELVAVTKRRSPHDAFVSKKGQRISQLKEGAIVGTSSLRRKAQLLLLRSDLEVVNLRGNVDTRLRKLMNSSLDGIICSLAALERLGIKNVFIQRLAPKYFLPAPGQGALGLQVRKDNKSIRGLLKLINHLPTFLCIKAERDFIHYLGGGCRLPLGAYATIRGDYITLKGIILNPLGSSAIRVKEVVPLKQSSNLGKRLAQKAVKLGALEILKGIEQ
jgi:hydroxymethylbilane synthase